MPTIVEVKTTVEDALLRIPGVVGVGIGPKYANYRPIGEIAIVVLVERKLPESSLRPEHVIPKEIQGFKTDVTVGGPTTHALDSNFLDPRRFRRGEGGLRGGIKIMPDIDEPGAGTLGCLAFRDIPAGRLVFATTCAHVVNQIVGGLTSPTPKAQGEKLGNRIG